MPRYIDADTPLQTWWFVDHDDVEIKTVQVVSAAYDTVMIPHFDASKGKAYARPIFNANRYFPTYEQARSFVVTRCANELERRRSALHLAEMFLDRANALPMEAPDADGK